MAKKITYHSLAGDAGVQGLLNPAGYQEVSNPDDADIIVFNGGEDVGTCLYGEKPISFSNEFASGRDRYEQELYRLHAGKKFLFGICRGSQFLNVMNGGKLWQDVNNHGQSHQILDLVSGKVYRATSTHHQQMRPTPDGELIAVASECTLKRAEGETQTINPKLTPDMDVEIVWYPKSRSLCVQGHPEYVPGSHFADYCLHLLHQFYREEVHA